MPDSSAAELHVRLPQPLEDEMERVGEGDPEAMERIVAYGVTRRVIFEYLLAREGGLEAGPEHSY